MFSLYLNFSEWCFKTVSNFFIWTYISTKNAKSYYSKEMKVCKLASFSYQNIAEIKSHFNALKRKV